MTLFFVCLGAAVGAPLRYLVDRAVHTRVGGVFPWGTLAVNVSGSFVLGLLVALAASHEVPEPVWLVVGPGFCGAFTTYSTLSYQTLRLTADGERRLALANVALSLTAGLAAAALGYLAGSAL